MRGDEPRFKEIEYAGRTWRWTGKVGRHVATGAHSAEYAAFDERGRETGARVWALEDGTVVENDAGPVPVGGRP